MAFQNIQRFQNQDLIRVGNDDNYLLLAPHYGGRLVRWVRHGEEILYWPEAADWSRPAKIRGGNPLLFPFIGRHFADGEAGRWRDANGTTHTLPQHGFARDLPFTVVAADDDKIVMALESSDSTRAGYPYAFRFEASYVMLEDGVEVALRSENTGSDRLPYYAGHHFYFSLPAAHRPDTRLLLPEAVRLRQEPDGRLTHAIQGEPAYALDDDRLQDTFHALRGGGSVTLAMPGRTLAIDLDVPGCVAWHAVTTWTESKDADFYCVEPWLGLPDAIHHGHGLRWLEPGEQETAVCRVRVVA
ncbi:aldose 1-epimerase [Cupriavidus necator]|uniref:Aldose 1-epimerase n=1 Tax=Cupriavidus pinatubonensis (strain JMP 134 / LMG 1197) TaxID=264198 RepID=Q474P2_CUPPJ|nr:aldose 1-epimerase [Cupriavidus necator]